MSGEEKMITITSILHESHFDEMMDNCQCFADLVWDTHTQYYEYEEEDMITTKVILPEWYFEGLADRCECPWGSHFGDVVWDTQPYRGEEE